MNEKNESPEPVPAQGDPGALAPCDAISRQTAIGLQTTNMIFCPGLGNYMGGVKVQGVIQIVIYAIGFALSITGLALIGAEFSAALGEAGDYQEAFNTIRFDNNLLIALAGVLIFLISWAWALVTGMWIIRQATLREEAAKQVTASSREESGDDNRVEL